MPPRHGKSELVTIRYPVWRILRQPNFRCIIGAYNLELAQQFSRRGQRIAEETGIELAITKADDWETTKGGGVRATGVGSGITGRGANLIMIDDPVKSREEANSPSYRRRCWDWYRDDLYTRLEPDGAIILIMTRWHNDDLAGRILDSDDGSNWTIISLPAEAGDNDPIGRELGAALCPDRFDADELQSIKKVLGNSYYALYQQSPVSPEGEMFKRAWFELVKEVPAQARRLRYWDKAGTEGGGARTAGVKMSEYQGVYYIEDVISGQWGAAEREAIIKQTALLDGPSTEVWIEQEPGSGGKESAENTIRMLAGFMCYADKVTGDKITRAEPLQSYAMAGNIKIKLTDWTEGYINDLTSFPYGKFKDKIDATSGAFNKMSIMGASLSWAASVHERAEAIRQQQLGLPVAPLLGQRNKVIGRF